MKEIQTAHHRFNTAGALDYCRIDFYIQVRSPALNDIDKIPHRRAIRRSYHPDRTGHSRQRQFALCIKKALCCQPLFYIFKLLLQSATPGNADIFDIELILAALGINRKFAVSFHCTAHSQPHPAGGFGAAEKGAFEQTLPVFQRQIDVTGAVNIQSPHFAGKPERHQAVFNKLAYSGVDFADRPDRFGITHDSSSQQKMKTFRVAHSE